MEAWTIWRLMLLLVLGAVAVIETWRCGKLEAENNELRAELSDVRGGEQ